ncbi:MAG: bis(5'-nucleosyl)-tetraphosphatase (symmetrical) YqeK [Mycoplasmataceae bacterium]|nr:bis(5'-nucleosyl)-tetraphosphatase (symmetrical) YqeK [Mycoplasmataceae bacterium]
MRIVNFAGSFDPIHNGHIEMVKKAFEDLKPDIFYITPISRSFTKTYSTSYAQRAEMIKLAISSLNNDKVKINYCEQDLDEGYSGYKHINDLKNYTNAEELYIVIGADHLADLETWDEIEWLTKNVIFYVFARRGLKVSQFAQKLIEEKRLIFNNNFDFEVGSYSQRVIPSFLNDKVIQYINENDLYSFQRLQSRLTNNRIKHSYRVAELAKEIALKHYPQLAKKAYTAGIYHDWCKESSDTQILTIIKNTKYEHFKHYFHRINNLHGIAASILLRTQLFFNDEDILHAINNHTYQFDDDVRILDKILYCADKLEPNRAIQDLDNIKKYRELVFVNLDETYNHIVKYQHQKFQHLKKEK